MTDGPMSLGEATGLTREQMTSALFANMVVQQTNMALVFLGKVPHPESKQTIREIEAARMFIDQLEMLEIKTRGNLNKEEERLLQQSLMMLRMEFVQSVESPPPRSATPASPASSPSQSSSEPQHGPAAASPKAKDPSERPASADSEESRKRFTKKY